MNLNATRAWDCHCFTRGEISIKDANQAFVLYAFQAFLEAGMKYTKQSLRTLISFTQTSSDSATEPDLILALGNFSIYALEHLKLLV